MAFALTGYKSYSRAAYEPVTAQFEQTVELTITRAATDTALDLGNPAGTFWTAALADVTFGALATKALAHWKTVQGKTRVIQNAGSREIENAFARVVSGATGAQYQLNASTPSALAFVLVSGQALATLRVVVGVSLVEGELPAPRAAL